MKDKERKGDSEERRGEGGGRLMKATNRSLILFDFFFCKVRHGFVRIYGYEHGPDIRKDKIIHVSFS